jgi:hypothetical protein
MHGQRGGRVRHRDIDAPSFEGIAANYASAVREALHELLALRAPSSGA